MSDDLSKLSQVSDSDEKPEAIDVTGLSIEAIRALPPGNYVISREQLAGLSNAGGKGAKNSYMGARPMVKRGECRWCGHWKRSHTGQTPQEIKDRPEFANVKWERNSCSVRDCKGCRRYEA